MEQARAAVKDKGSKKLRPKTTSTSNEIDIKPPVETQSLSGGSGTPETSESGNSVSSGSETNDARQEQPKLEFPESGFEDFAREWDRGGRTDKNSLSPLYATIRRIIDSNNNCVCLVQVGSFYELYFEQAAEYGPRLGLKVVNRKNGAFGVPMSGFPVYQLQKFVKALVQDHEATVAIVDQYPDRGVVGDTLIHRKVSRIISPGTLVDEIFLNYSQNNYLAAILLPSNCTKTAADPDMAVGLLWIDISVGEFYVQNTTLGDVMADIARVNPSEIIILREFQDYNLTGGKWFTGLQDLRRYFLRYHKITYRDFKMQFKSAPQRTRKQVESFTVREEAAMNMVLSYVNVNLPDSNPSLDVPQQYFSERCLQMDSRTREALELTERATGGRSLVVGSLFTTIRRTVTPLGTRLLTQWITSPILDIAELRRRQRFVGLFKDNDFVCMLVRHQLGRLGDFVRLVQRLSFGTGDSVTHLASIADGLHKVGALGEYLGTEADRGTGKGALDEFMAGYDVPLDVAKEISNTLVDTSFGNGGGRVYDGGSGEKTASLLSEGEASEEAGLSTEEDTSLENEVDESPEASTSPENETEESPEASTSLVAFSVRRDHDPVLSSLHDALERSLQEESELLSSIKTTVSEVDPRLNITKKPFHGRHANVLYVSGRVKLIEALSSTLSHDDVRDRRRGFLLYKPTEWGRLQTRLQEETDAIREHERIVIAALREKVLLSVPQIREVGRLVDFLDVTAAFAVLAHECGWICPTLVQKPILSVDSGRHAVVESGLKTAGSMFTPNDTRLGTDGRVWVVSGPNMGGKSTYLRQNALIVILAQMGLYVPADKARIGVVDRLFTRIGASDDLFSDLSTFMVEMVETSFILKNATPRLLAIVDEVGRGTSGKEGLAIAYATLVSLCQNNKCRTLFATHFGRELEEMLQKGAIDDTDVKYVRTTVIKTETGVLIDHALEDGISERSYALEVAEMAGFPPEALEHAKKAMLMMGERNGKNESV